MPGNSINTERKIFMKTLNELYAEVMNSEELKNEFLTLKTPEDIVAFAAKHGCTATLDEIKAFFEEKAQAVGELSEDELTQVAGGKGANGLEATYSALTFGIACVVHTIESAVRGRCGTGIKGKAMLCAMVTDDGKEINPITEKELK